MTVASTGAFAATSKVDLQAVAASAVAAQDESRPSPTRDRSAPSRRRRGRRGSRPRARRGGAPSGRRWPTAAGSASRPFGDGALGQLVDRAAASVGIATAAAAQRLRPDQGTSTPRSKPVPKPAGRGAPSLTTIHRALPLAPRPRHIRSRRPACARPNKPERTIAAAQPSTASAATAAKAPARGRPASSGFISIRPATGSAPPAPRRSSRSRDRAGSR